VYFQRVLYLQRGFVGPFFGAVVGDPVGRPHLQHHQRGLVVLLCASREDHLQAWQGLQHRQHLRFHVVDQDSDRPLRTTGEPFEIADQAHQQRHEQQ
jgi:hypothetical protein